MGINNKSNSAQAYNFNILFSIDNLMRMDIAYTASSKVYNWIDQEIKFGNLSGTSDFYTNLSNVNYDWITERAGGGGGTRLFPGDYMAASNYFELNHGGNPGTIDRAFRHALVSDPANLVAYNFSYFENNFIEAHGELSFNIRSLVFTLKSE